MTRNRAVVYLRFEADLDPETGHFNVSQNWANWAAWTLRALSRRYNGTCQVVTVGTQVEEDREHREIDNRPKADAGLEVALAKLNGLGWAILSEAEKLEMLAASRKKEG